MTMTNADLAAHLNREFGLSGDANVTPNVIRQWVLWDVLPKATATGRALGQRPNWNRDARSYRRARRLTELRIAGLRGENSVIAQAYFEWGHPDFERVREAIANEFRRNGARLMKRLTSDPHFKSIAEVSSARRKAIRRQIGPLDDRFIGTEFEQSPEFYVSAANLIRTGQANSAEISELIAKATAQIAPNFADAVGPAVANYLPLSLSGLFGSSDEIDNSAVETVSISSERQFRIARWELRKQIRFIRSELPSTQIPELENLDRLKGMLIPLAPQITVGKWAVCGFVAVLHALRNSNSALSAQ